MAPLAASKVPRRPRSLQTSIPDVVTSSDLSNDDEIITILRKHEDENQPITANDPDAVKIQLSLLKKNSTLLSDLFDKRIEGCDTESLKVVIYDPRQDPAKKSMNESGIYINELVRFAIANEVTGYEFIENLTVWDVFVGVRGWLEWARKPGYLWNGDNIYVVAMSVHVAEWLGASEEFKAALMAKKMFLARGAPVRGMGR
ncbi:hypothetical protein L207DRAFT_642325 [Hyaloscypha variabilis F]|uniref:Uncharacterized protein n=1 Tax=Hyaloscypha variabilis (strain UAMH 11265 / GT02V1 / F) TaxID=1149755 RepID=A0A2J6QTI5_HYAVF|nr:hypothetical protein L207DRAFT_642325 [Hyaloscypha variabilis F]